MMEEDCLGENDIYNTVAESQSADLYVLQTIYRKTQSILSKRGLKTSFFALHLICGGRGKLITPNSEIELSDGDIWFRFPNQLYRFYHYDDTPWSFFHVTFQGLTAFSLLERIGLDADRCVVRAPKNAKELLTECIISCMQNPECSDLTSVSVLMKIIADLATIYHKKSIEKQTPVQQYVRKAHDYINHNYTDPLLSAKNVADYLGLNIDYFLRIFNQQVGSGFARFLTLKRLNESALLLTTELNSTIESISERVGYASHYYFCVCFKKKYHTTPMKYREQMQIQNSEHI
jgi:AraC-like DNA-binding protein